MSQIPILQPHFSKVQSRSRTYLDKGVTTKHQPHKPKKKSVLASERLEVRKASKGLLVGLLDELNTMESKEISDKVKLCGSKFSVITCGSHIVTRQPLFRCEHRLCPFCASRQSKDKLKKYLPKAVAFVRHSPVPVTPCHLVLTLTHREGETIRQAKKRLYDAFRKLIRRDFWEEHFAGGLYKIEATVDKNGLWHCHLHAVVFRKKFVKDLEQFRSEWLAVTGDSSVLRLDKLTDVRSGLVEVLKYITKPNDFEKYTVEHIRQLLELKGERMFGVFGEFSKFARKYTPSDNEMNELFERFDYAEGDCCPHCENPLFSVILSDSATIDFCRRLESMPKPKMNKIGHLKKE